MKINAKRIISLVLTVAMLASLMIQPAFAAEVRTHLDGSEYTVERVSNIDRKEGEIDGLTPGGDRENSYCWAMAENKGYVYIGTWANGLYQELQLIQSVAGIPIEQDYIDSLMILLTHGEVDPLDPDSVSTAKIIRFNEKTGEMEVIFDPSDYESGDYSAIYGFRGATEFKGNVYMDAMLNSYATDCQLWRITDENPYATPECVLKNGSLRAICVSCDGEHMYSGGSCEIPEGYTCGAVIFGTETGDAGDFYVVADSADFATYTKTSSTITVNDVVCYPNDAYECGEELIASIISDFGVTIYRGHPAEEDELASANAYGWVWTEFVGLGGKYPISLGNNLNCTLTPAVFNDELYFMSMTNPMTPQIIAYMGFLTQNTDILYMGIDQIAATIDSECSIYRMTRDGRIQMVMGDQKFCPASIEYVANLGDGFSNDEYGLTMYAWREVTYNDRMYVCTIDVWNMYNWLTQLTNGELLNMDEEEYADMLLYLIDFITKLNSIDNSVIEMVGSEELAKPVLDILAQTELGQLKQENLLDSFLDSLYEVYGSLGEIADPEILMQILQFAAENGETLDLLLGIVSALINNPLVPASLKQLAENAAGYLEMLRAALKNIVANKDHINNYILISNTCKNHTTPGGEVWCSTNGTDWEAITVNGFNDKYNHGIRTMALGDDGYLYMGTANPYYGAQLWRMLDDGNKPAPAPVLPRYLELEKHNAFIHGYEDGTVRPNGNITRAEASVMFYNLLNEATVGKYTTTGSSFPDVPSNTWFSESVYTLCDLGIVHGNDKGYFLPNANITRAEFAVMVANFYDDPQVEPVTPFTDVSGHWAEEAINLVHALGIINGYEDGSFRPDEIICRAEAMTIICNLLGRCPNENSFIDGMITFPDNVEGDWYYVTVLESANTHDYVIAEGAEIWTELHN